MTYQNTSRPEPLAANIQADIQADIQDDTDDPFVALPELAGKGWLALNDVGNALAEQNLAFWTDLMHEIYPDPRPHCAHCQFEVPQLFRSSDHPALFA